MRWTPFENGKTIGTRGSEDGIILVDDEHDLGARITLERDGSIAPFAITCGIYGSLLHTRFFSARETAERNLEEMKQALELILFEMPDDNDPERDVKREAVTDAIMAFVERFPT